MEGAIETAERVETFDQLISEATATLTVAGVRTPRLDAELLMAAACGLNRTALYAHVCEPAPQGCRETFRRLVLRRQRREPLQYIVGRQEFWSLDFAVTPAVLIPRPETELLVEMALDIWGCPLPPSLSTVSAAGASTSSARTVLGSFHSKSQTHCTSPLTLSSSKGQLPVHRQFRQGQEAERKATLCDVGAGSGCIAVALARELPRAKVWALDVAVAALAVAEANARRYGVADRVHFLQSDLFASVAGMRFDAIVSNPPYLSAADFAHLQPEVAFEPRPALDGGATGLDCIRRLLAAAPQYLVEGGWLLMEIGAAQGPAVETCARAAGFGTVSIRLDYAGLPRVLLARR